MSQGEIQHLDRVNYLLENSGKRANHHKSKRIVTQGITGADEKYRLKATIIESGIFCAHSVNYVILENKDVSPKYVLGLISSSLLNWYFKVFSSNSNVNGY